MIDYEEKYMGDRTYVTLSFPTELLAEVESIPEHEPNDHWSSDVLTHFGYQEINYGDLQFLENLREMGIPYNSCWEAGCEFGAGTEYCRFTAEGEMELINVYDADINPDMDVLLKLIHDYDALKRYILNYKEDTTPLPWDDQVKNSKIYRTRQLIHA